jgi:uncharacterized membrane protein
MSENALHLIVAAFQSEAGAEEGLVTLKESRDEELIGVQAAVAMRKDTEGQLHFKDVGLTPGKGALGGVVLGAVVGVLTGGTGLALGAVGALVGGLVGRKKQDSSLPSGRINQIASSLAPGSSAVVIVMESGWGVVVEEQLELLGGDVMSVDIPAEVAEQPEAERDAAYAALVDQLKRTENREGAP